MTEIVQKEMTFEDLLERVEREEADGTFPVSHKISGLLLPGLKEQMKRMGIKDHEIARALKLHGVSADPSSIGKYRRCDMGVKGIERAILISRVLGLPHDLELLTTYKGLAKYHSPSNSASNSVFSRAKQGAEKRMIVESPSSKKQSQINNVSSGPNTKNIADLENRVRNLEQIMKSLKGKRGFFSRIFS